MSVAQAIPIEIRLYDRLFRVENAAEEGDFKDYINPNSLQVIPNAFAEPEVAKSVADGRYQFMRKGYFALDRDSTKGKLVFNRTTTLRDNWSRESAKG